MLADGRPRNVGPARAAGILYGDWGTSKAYVLGIAFALAGYSSFPLLVAIGILTGIVGLNYYWVCASHPDGGGVYSSWHHRSRLVATVGALLLIADYLVTASLSVLEGVNYLAHTMENQLGMQIYRPELWAVVLIAAIGLLNWWGPRHSGAFAVILAIPASIAAASIALMAIPYLGQAHFVKSSLSLGQNWMLFAGMILALSGVEAVSNTTGIMIPDPGSTPEKGVTVKRTSAIAISIVAVEVVTLTIILSWAMHAVPGLSKDKPDAMLGQMADYFGRQRLGPTWGPRYASFVGIPMALLLLSAGNTAIIDMISVLYMMANDREMPSAFGKLNRHGVPKIPLFVAATLPCLILLLFPKVSALASLYAIGVVGAITLNLAGSATNRRISLGWLPRVVMGATALVMLCIWVSIAVEKHDAVVFAISILALGLLARSFVHERRMLREAAEMMVVTDNAVPATASPMPLVIVALRGVTETLRFAAAEARLRGGRLAVLFVREVKVMIAVEPKPEEDEDAVRIFKAGKIAAGDVPFEFIYRVSNDAAPTILQVTTEREADFLVLGASAEGAVARLLRGPVVATIAQGLPDRTRLLVYSWKVKKM